MPRHAARSIVGAAMFTSRLIQAVSGLSFALLVIALPAHAENGVAADKIVFGQAAALDGPAAALGQGMREGLLAAFGEANKSGGIKGRKIELISVDDGYEPTKSIARPRSSWTKTRSS